MKKVLILAYDFPPYVSVGGLRPYNWYKYLHEFGVEPIVVTRQWSNNHGNQLDYITESESIETIVLRTDYGIEIRTPYIPNSANRLMLKYGESKYRFLRKSISAFYELAQWFWNVGPKSQLYTAAQEYLKNNKVDAIIATGDPFILFKFASKLSKEFNIPWIADYRDPWTQNKSNSSNFLLKLWNSFMEKSTIKSALFVITVSDFVKSKISDLIKNKEFRILPNGFSPESVGKASDIVQKTDILNICFVGTIYKWHPIISFLSVLSKFIDENKEVKLSINFYGINNANSIIETVREKFPDLIDIINVFPRIPNDKLLTEIAPCNLMLLFNDYSIIGTKIYDYIGLKRAILLCYANDYEAFKLKEKYYTVDEVENLSQHLQEDLINETNGGYIAQDAAHLKVLLSQLYEEFVQTGEIKCHTQNVEKYSRRAQTEELAKIIKQLAVNSDQLSAQNESSQLAVSSDQLSARSESREQLTDSSNQLEAGEEELKVESLKFKVESEESGSSFHEKPSYQQCSRCVMDTSDVDIHFDEKGVCNHCTNYFERIASRVYQGEKSDKELMQLVENIKKAGKGKKYDCVIGVSGGIDSSYVAYKAKKRGLRALLVHLDNGWNSEISVKNIKNLARILEFDYESYVLDWEEFREIQLAFLKASIPEMETPTDIAIPGALHQVAAKYGVKYILSGGNFATEGILPKTWHYNAKDMTYFNHILRTFGRKKMRKFPRFGWKEELYYKLVHGIKISYILNYVPYNKQEAMQVLENELGWKYYGGKHYESKYTGFVQSYIMPEKFNMDYRRATLSTQICTGEVTREIALDELKHKPYDSVSAQHEKEYVCKKLGISINEFDEIMSRPAKVYRDYPNAEGRLEFIYDIYRKVYKKPNYKE